jgi:hypothetical protein
LQGATAPLEVTMEHPVFNLDTEFKMLGLSLNQLLFWLFATFFAGMIGMDRSGIVGLAALVASVGSSLYVSLRTFNTFAFTGIRAFLTTWLLQPMKYELLRDPYQVPLTLEDTVDTSAREAT